MNTLSLDENCFDLDDQKYRARISKIEIILKELMGDTTIQKLSLSAPPTVVNSSLSLDNANSVVGVNASASVALDSKTSLKIPESHLATNLPVATSSTSIISILLSHIETLKSHVQQLNKDKDKLVSQQKLMTERLDNILSKTHLLEMEMKILSERPSLDFKQNSFERCLNLHLRTHNVDAPYVSNPKKLFSTCFWSKNFKI